MVSRNSLLFAAFATCTSAEFICTSAEFITCTSGTNSPFDGIDIGWTRMPSFGDVDGDGDLDLVVGETYFLNYYENVGSAASPSYEARTGTANPFDGINVGEESAPAFVDLDGDGDLDLVVGNADGTLFFFANGYCLSLIHI